MLTGESITMAYRVLRPTGSGALVIASPHSPKRRYASLISSDSFVIFTKTHPMDFTGYDKSFGLTNKVSLITRGAAGIGRAIATLFAEKAAKLVLADLNPDIPKIAQEICADANRVETVTADLTNTADREQGVQADVKRFGRIDILVNNAGIVLLDDALNLSEEY